MSPATVPVPVRTAPATVSDGQREVPSVHPVAAAAPSPTNTAKLVPVPAGSVDVAGKPVTVAGFAIDRTEVTVKDYAHCVSQKKCSAAEEDDLACNWPQRKKKPDHPINCVTVKQAERYCEQNGQRLPTAAEWTLAAGGPEKRYYPWGAAHPSNIAVTEPVGRKFAPGPGRHNLCWVGDDTDREKYPIETCPVGGYPSGNTPSGIADLAGNVAEWTSTTEKLPHGALRYQVKGGGYSFDKLGRLEVAVADVTLQDVAHQAPDVGFRCVTAKAAAAP